MFSGERLKEIRLDKKLSQQEFGDLLDLSKVSICGYEKGNRTPTIDNFLNMLDKLEVSPEYLLGRDIFVINEDKTNYTKAISTTDLNILKSLYQDKKLYRQLCEDAPRTIELIHRKLYK